MKFAYRPYQVRLVKGKPLQTVWRPIVQVLLHGPLGSVRLNVLLDSGADHTLFPREFADALGIEIRDDQPGSIRGVGGKPLTAWYGDADLEIVGQEGSHRWHAPIQFAPVNIALLGQLGCLEFFKANLNYADRVFELEPNEAYLGT